MRGKIENSVLQLCKALKFATKSEHFIKIRIHFLTDSLSKFQNFVSGRPWWVSRREWENIRPCFRQTLSHLWHKLQQLLRRDPIYTKALDRCETIFGDFEKPISLPAVTASALAALKKNSAFENF